MHFTFYSVKIEEMTTLNGECDLTYVGFNQNFSSLAVGTKQGFKIFRVKSFDELTIEREFEWTDVYIFERFFETFMAALVSRQNPENTVLYNIYENKEIICFKGKHEILSVRINSKRLLTCCSKTLRIYDLTAMKELHVIRDTPSNARGVVALSPRNVSYVAYPGSALQGVVHVFDADSLKAVSVISAHNSTVAAMAFNTQGTLLATASERGTVIRIFFPETSEKFMEFRRGSLIASIYSLSFSVDSTYLACSSNSRTVHIFRLSGDESSRRENSEESQANNGWWRYFGGVIQNSAMMLQSSASYIAGEMLLPLKRAFAITYLPSAYVRNTCAFLINSKFQVLLVATVDGQLFTYAIDAINGGECALLKQQRFSDVEHTASPNVQQIDSGSTVAEMKRIAFSGQSTGASPPVQRRPVFILGSTSNRATAHPKISEARGEADESCDLTDKFEKFQSNSDFDCCQEDVSGSKSNSVPPIIENEIEAPSLGDAETTVAAATSTSRTEETWLAGTLDAGDVLPGTDDAMIYRDDVVTYPNDVMTYLDVDRLQKCRPTAISCSFSLLEDIAPRELPDVSRAQAEDDCLVYGPVPKQTYASVVISRRQGDSPEERKAEAEAALRDAVDGDNANARRI